MRLAWVVVGLVLVASASAAIDVKKVEIGSKVFDPEKQKMYAVKYVPNEKLNYYYTVAEDDENDWVLTAPERFAEKYDAVGLKQTEVLVGARVRGPDGSLATVRRLPTPENNFYVSVRDDGTASETKPDYFAQSYTLVKSGPGMDGLVTVAPPPADGAVRQAGQTSAAQPAPPAQPQSPTDELNALFDKYAETETGGEAAAEPSSSQAPEPAADAEKNAAAAAELKAYYDALSTRVLPIYAANAHDPAKVRAALIAQKWSPEDADAVVKRYEDAKRAVAAKAQFGQKMNALSRSEKIFYQTSVEDPVLFKRASGSKLTADEQRIADSAPWYRKFETGVFGSSAVQAINYFFSGYEQYRGLGAYGSLFIDEDWLSERRADVNRVFCDTIIFGGTQCWAQKICEGYSDVPLGGSIAFAVTPGGSYQFVAHIEGEVSEVAFAPESPRLRPELLYKVTYGITNPDKDEPLGYSVSFEGARRYFWYPEVQVVPKGGSVSAKGATAIVAYSRNVYNSVCLVFDREVVMADGRRVSKVCNEIRAVAGRPTAPYAEGAVGTSSPGAVAARGAGEGF